MPKPIIKPKVFSNTHERTNLPVARKSKIGMDIKEISDYKRLEKAFYSNDPINRLSNLESKKYLFMKKRIMDHVHIENIISRDKKLSELLGIENNTHRLSEAINRMYKNHISAGLDPKSKYLKVSNPHAISFNWKYDKELDTVHMFEWNNIYGLDSKNPLYNEFKKQAIDTLRYSSFTKNTKFVVDSEEIDK